MTMPGMLDEPLFGADGDEAAAAQRAPVLSCDQRRSAAHLTRLEAGWHPLAWLAWGLRLHAEAAPLDDQDAAGRRCGNCRDFVMVRVGDDRVSKCELRWTYSSASNCRAWWPGCTDHRYNAQTQSGVVGDAALHLRIHRE